MASAPLPASEDGTYALQVHVFDDRVRARVGETTVEAERGDLRDGLMAVVLDGPGGCAALHVDGLDGYVTQLTTSRYASFAEHIASWDQAVTEMPGDAGAVPALLSATASEIAAAMTAGADAQGRQRLFDRWIAELAIPLAADVAGLRLHHVGQALLVVESPEPLAFSRDVSLRVTHRVVRTPPAPDVPRPLLRFAAGLAFRRTDVAGPVPDDVAAVVGRARTLVHAVRAHGLPGAAQYRVYSVRVRVDADGTRLVGTLVAEQSRPPRLPTFPPRPLPLPVDHIALLDAAGRPLTPAIPLPVERVETLDLAVLTNSAEDRAVLIPAGPIEPDTYTFELAIDRPRYRGDPSPYQETATFVVQLGG
jgi:hypothetical protein